MEELVIVTTYVIISLALLAIVYWVLKEED